MYVNECPITPFLPSKAKKKKKKLIQIAMKMSCINKQTSKLKIV